MLFKANLIKIKPVRLINKYSSQKKVYEKFKYLSASELKKAMEQQHLYVKNNHKIISSQISNLAKNHKWLKVKQISNAIDLNDFDSQESLRQISNGLMKGSNTSNLSSMDFEQLLNITISMNLLNFQTKIQKQKASKTAKVQNSLPFIQNIGHRLKVLSKIQIYMLASKLIHTNPQLFQPYRSIIKNTIIQQLNTKINTKACYQILWKSMASNYWSEDFLKQAYQIAKKNEYYQIISLIQFSNPKQFKNKIEKTYRKIKRRQTEQEVEKILKGYEYQFQSNSLINSFEIDFLINNNIIIEFNGRHHYCINTQEPTFTVRQIWRSNIFQKRGFIFCILPYYQWKDLNSSQKKRKYTVMKIQNCILDYIKSNKIQ